jgi:hypothetical protein
MKDTEFKLLDLLSDSVNDKFEELHKAGAFDDILQKLKDTTGQLPDTYSVSFDIRMNVFDSEGEKSISLLNTGFNASKGREPYRHYGDTSPQKYFVNGQMCTVPDEFCPHCWGQWDFKFKHPLCPECGYELGKQVKYLIDNDVCPYCQEGKITIDSPTCDKCGFKVDEKKVVWG